MTGRVCQKIPRFTVYPSSHYVTPRDKVLAAVETIKIELDTRLKELVADGKLVEAVEKFTCRSRHRRMNNRGCLLVDSFNDIGPSVGGAAA